MAGGGAVKVAFLIERFDPKRGGMETSAAEFLTEIAALGHEMHVVTQSAPDEFAPATIHRLGLAGLGRAGRYRHFVTEAEQLLATTSWDVVHAVTPCQRCDLYQPRSGTAREALARTIAVRRHSVARFVRRMSVLVNRKERLLSRLESGLFRRQNPPMVAALSSYMRRQLLEAYPIPKEKIRDVFNGVTISLPSPEERALQRVQLRAELGLPETALAAIFVAHNFRRKGLPRLLEALAAPSSQEWHLLVVGKDRPTPYQRQARKLGLGPRIHFLGSRSDVRQLYHAADTAVLPSYYDPCSRTILEAMSLGLPCVASRYDGSSDCIRPRENGFVVDPEDISGLVEALAQLAQPARRYEMGVKALSLRPYLAMRRHAEQISAIYQELGG